MFSGGYFYSYHMMHLACTALFTKGVDEDATLTNNHHPGFISTLYPVLIMLKSGMLGTRLVGEA